MGRKILAALCGLLLLTGGASALGQTISGGAVAAVGTPSSYVGPVGSNGRISRAYSATNKQFNAVSPTTLNSAQTRLKVVLPGWWWDATTFAEIPLTGATTFSASLEYPDGVCTPFTFSGAATGTVTNGQELESDFLYKSLPAGTYKLRFYMASTDGIVFVSPFTGTLPTALGSKFEFAASGLADKTASCAAVGAQATLGFTPLAVLGDTNKPTVLLVGDSITAGTGYANGGGDTFASFVEEALGPSYATVNTGSPGDLSTNLTASSRRVQLKRYVSHVYVAHMFNDITVGGVSLATAQTRFNTLAGLFADKRVLANTVSYSSTGAWTNAAASDQTLGTASALNGVTDQFNDWLLTRPAPLVKVFDPYRPGGGVFRSDNKWQANGASARMTGDGVHPSTLAAHIASLAIDARAFSREGL